MNTEKQNKKKRTFEIIIRIEVRFCFTFQLPHPHFEFNTRIPRKRVQFIIGDFNHLVLYCNFSALTPLSNKIKKIPSYLSCIYSGVPSSFAVCCWWVTRSSIGITILLFSVHFLNHIGSILFWFPPLAFKIDRHNFLNAPHFRICLRRRGLRR